MAGGVEEPFVLRGGAGLRAVVNANGSLRRLDCGAVSLALFVGNELEGGPTNVYLRRRAPMPECTALLGPRSPTRFRAGADGRSLIGEGAWRGVEYAISLVLADAAPAWFWQVRLRNSQAGLQRLDLTYAQDLALAPYGAVRLNEYYVSQYLDHTPLRHPQHGYLLAARQNQAVDGRWPWCLLGSLGEAVGYATDALQFHALASRRGETPVGLSGELPNRRRQHEHALAVLRDAGIELAAGESVTRGFFGAYSPDHPLASDAADLGRVTGVLALAPDAVPTAAAPTTAAPAPGPGADPSTLFSAAPLFAARELAHEQLIERYREPWRHVECDAQGRPLSFFTGNSRHVVLRRKERQVLRPHGHILRSGAHLTPDESALTSTVWMAGVFHSMVTQGHVNINRFLSTVHGYLGLFRSHGQRVFAELGGGWQLLDVPSVFEMSASACRWIYRHADGEIEVESSVLPGEHALGLRIQVRGPEPLRFLVSNHVALNGDDGSESGAVHWRVEAGEIAVAPAPGSDLARRFPAGDFRLVAAPGTRIERIGGDELLFLDGRSRGQPFLCLITAPAMLVALHIRGRLIDGAAGPRAAAARPQTASPGLALVCPDGAAAAGAGDAIDAAQRLVDLLPWLTHDALVHYLAPRGLEQYSGGGWGTRDVCQGPVEWLLAAGRTEALRELLLIVMRAQNPDGDWPQWFSFFERERDIRAGDSHGDIVFWPVLALAQYLLASGDVAVLDVEVPFFDARGPTAGERAGIWEHVQRALSLGARRVVPGTALAAYGHGDWNDSLQPVDPQMRAHMCSAWTVTLHHQTLTTLGRALHAGGREREAGLCTTAAAAIADDFRRLLLPDGVLAGFGLFDGGGVTYLLHPRDSRTGIHYSALAMIHAILEGLLSPPQARAHLALMRTHLWGPDGLRLFDRPFDYHGGVQRLFQRAESATFFGREIGLMYTHAHLRYAQALAHVGEAAHFWRALCLSNPIGIRDLVPSATLRQANCYFSSSDAAFADRAEASAQYERVARGDVPLDGGWRVYSSGAGICVSLVMRRWLGLEREGAALLIDPVMPRELDGLCIETRLSGEPLEVRYRVASRGCGVLRLELNDSPLAFTEVANPYRRGAARVLMGAVQALWRHGRNRLSIQLS